MVILTRSYSDRARALARRAGLNRLCAKRFEDINNAGFINACARAARIMGDESLSSVIFYNSRVFLPRAAPVASRADRPINTDKTHTHIRARVCCIG